MFYCFNQAFVLVTEFLSSYHYDQSGILTISIFPQYFCYLWLEFSCTPFYHVGTTKVILFLDFLKPWKFKYSVLLSTNTHIHLWAPIPAYRCSLTLCRIVGKILWSFKADGKKSEGPELLSDSYYEHISHTEV